MSRFGDIHFDECNEEYGEGLYDGRKFIVLPEEKDEQGNVADCIVEGHFSDDERLFIWTQWELQSVVHRIMQVDSFADVDDMYSPAELTEEEHEEWLNLFLNRMEEHMIGVLSESVFSELLSLRSQLKGAEAIPAVKEDTITTINQAKEMMEIKADITNAIKEFAKPYAGTLIGEAFADLLQEIDSLRFKLQQAEQERNEYKAIADGYAQDILAAHKRWLRDHEKLQQAEQDRDGLRGVLEEVLCRGDHIPLVADYLRHYLSCYPVHENEGDPE